MISQYSEKYVIRALYIIFSVGYDNGKLAQQDVSVTKHGMTN